MYLSKPLSAAVCLLLATLALQSTIAAARDRKDEDQGETASDAAIATKAAPNYLVAFKPLLDFGDDGTGDVGLSLGAEARIGEKWYATAEIATRRADRSNENISDIKDSNDSDEDVIVKKRYGNALLGGLRYYGRPQASSWYAGGDVGVVRVDATYVVDESTVTEHATGIPLMMGGGYRWLLADAWTIRVGGRGGLHAYANRSLKGDDSEGASAARQKVRDDSPELLPSFELAFGYAW